MAGEEHACGPEADPELFAELEAVFDRFPGQSEKYIITCVDHETEIMGIDFATQEGHKRIEGDTIVTTFHPRSTPGPSDKVIIGWPPGLVCCGWTAEGRCWYWWVRR